MHLLDCHCGMPSCSNRMYLAEFGQNTVMLMVKKSTDVETGFTLNASQLSEFIQKLQNLRAQLVS